MKVEILEPKGYCAGVTNAINLAIKVRNEHPNDDVFVLGMLVHNDFVINYLKSKNITVIENSEEKGSIYDQANNLKDGSIVIFTAHGHTRTLHSLALSKNFAIYDAICPKVEQNIKTIENNLKNGHQAIYIGIKNHQEVEASLSLDKNVLFYDVKGTFDFSLVTDNSPLVVNQTTLNVLDLKDIHNLILKNIPDARIENEICNATRRRQQAIIELEDDVDAIIVVGDKKSSNTNRLFEIAKTSHHNALALMVSNADEINLKELQNKNRIVISSGASTPIELINAIYELLTK